MPNFRLLTQLGEKIISIWALVGGLILLSVVSLNIGSIIGSIVLIHVPGDFELTQIGVAIAVSVGVSCICGCLVRCFLGWLLLSLWVFREPVRKQMNKQGKRIKDECS